MGHGESRAVCRCYRDRVRGRSTFGVLDECRGTNPKLRDYAYVLAMRGDVNDAYGYFETAEELQRRADRRHPKLVSLADIWFCDLLIRIGYVERAAVRIKENLPLCAEQGWADDEARCNLLWGRIALTEGEDEEAQERFDKSEKAMRR